MEHQKPSDALLLVIRESLESVLFWVKASHVQRVLDKLGYKNYRCGYIRERYHALGYPIKNNWRA